MPVLHVLARTAAVTFTAGRRLTAGGVHTGRFLARQVGSARYRGGAGEAGMMRLHDLHAASCAGDTLVAIGLAGTVFFAVPVGQARGRVALYLLVTMLPFALLAPVVGPVLDRFRHGRRYALAVTMLGRAFLAYAIGEHIGGFTVYPAAFGMLVLSRAYGVARSAAVPRVLPAGPGLYGFLALFLAFSIRAHHNPVGLPGVRLPATTAIGLVAGALAIGSFLATAVGTTMRIHRPAVLQAGAITVTAAAAAFAALRYSLLTVAVLCLLTAIGSGLAKLAVDAVIQERVPEGVRASAFAHSETLLMLAWVAGGGLGLIPF